MTVSERTGFLSLLVIMVLLFLVLLSLTWARWGDPVVDTGRELEVAWKASMGWMLYRDMAYNYGPFSPYLNALFLMLFGTKLNAIVLCGILSAALGAWLTFRVCQLYLDRIPSLLMVGVFLFEFAFQHYYANGNFNFILPYSFPAVHATLAALGVLLLLKRHLDNGKRAPLVGAGVLVGLAFLCKVEIAGAIAVPTALAPLALGLRSGKSMKAVLIDAASWAMPMVLVTMAGFLPFITSASFHQVVWENVFKPQLVDFRANVFFMERLGFEGLNENLVELARSFLFWGVLAAVLLAGNRLPRKIAWVSVLVAVAIGWWLLPWEIEFRCLPVVALITGAASLFLLFKRKQEGAHLFAFSLFALISLLRIFLTAGTYHYGFCLALPGVLLFAVFLARLLPQWLPVTVKQPRFHAFAAMLVLLILGGRSFFSTSMEEYNEKSVVIQGPAGQMAIQPLPLGLDLELAMEQLNRAGTEATLLVLPEGAAFNFLSGQLNPTYYNLFIPPELIPPGVEEAVIEQIEEHAVDRILLIHRVVWEYGYQGLGIDYGMKLMAYIGERYEEETSYGPPPYGPSSGGCVIFRRR